MKICPKCNQTYTDDNLNFCLNDGEYLTPTGDNAPPTVFMDPPRVTNQTNWQDTSYQPPAPWQNQPQGMQNQPYGMPALVRSQDQTLPIVALVLGVMSLLFSCGCYGGLWLGIPAIVVGYLGMTNSNNDPNRYGGKGMAIAGIILGGVTLLLTIGFILIFIFSSLV